MNVTAHADWLKTHLPSWMFKLGAQSWIDREYPRHLFIETTAACQLTCGYCPRERRGNHMDYGLFRGIVDEATEYGPRSFSLHLFGEPLLFPFWEKAVRYIKARDSRHTVLLTTNGIRLNQEADRVVDSGISQVFWTWRPEARFTPQTKEKLRRWGKFRVRFIKEVTPPEAYEEWKNWENVEGRKIHNYGGNINISEFNMENSQKRITSLSQSKTESGSLPITNSGVQNQKRWPCYHLWLAPAVAWNGDLLMCCADPHRKEVLGHFPDTSVHAMWTGARLQAIRDSHLRGEYTGICAGCDVWKAYPDLFFAWQKR